MSYYIGPNNTIFVQTGSVTIANSVVQTSLVGTGKGNLTLPANYFYEGKFMEGEMTGSIATTGNPTARIVLKIGTTTIVDSTAIAVASLTGTQDFFCGYRMTCRSAGASGSLRTHLYFRYETTTGSSSIQEFVIPGTTTVFDTTAAGLIDILYTWGTASASNTITSNQFIVRSLS